MSVVQTSNAVLIEETWTGHLQENQVPNEVMGDFF